MNPALIGLIVALSVVALTVFVFIPYQKMQKVEGYSEEQVSIGVGVTAGLVIVIFAVFFLFFYSIPKEPNVIRTIKYYNLD